MKGHIKLEISDYFIRKYVHYSVNEKMKRSLCLKDTRSEMGILFPKITEQVI